MKLLIFSALILFTQMSLAQIDRKGNGGDMCEDHFKIIRDDISDWINKGGSAGLVFPVPITLSLYNAGMLDKIATAQVSCVDTPVMIGPAEKTCINFANADGTLQIVCNRGRFLTTSDADQYVLVHHKYAGLAGFEVNSGVSSDYTISNQITNYVRDRISKKLGVKPRPTPSCESIQQNLLKDGNKCVTSKGVTYEFVWTPTMGWKGPDGLVWSYRQERPMQYLPRLVDAHFLCDDYGGTLPTTDEYQQAEANGFREIFYDMNTGNRFYWVAPVSDSDPFATYFMGLDGKVALSGWSLKDATMSVRCVGR